jgi:hypothetical protein
MQGWATAPNACTYYVRTRANVHGYASRGEGTIACCIAGLLVPADALAHAHRDTSNACVRASVGLYMKRACSNHNHYSKRTNFRRLKPSDISFGPSEIGYVRRH